jgi:hypothetical protein
MKLKCFSIRNFCVHQPANSLKINVDLMVTQKTFSTNLLMASHYICFLFDQYRWQCLPCKMDKQLAALFFHCCNWYFARALLKGSVMENNNCFEWHVLLIFHLNSYRSFVSPHVPSWPVWLFHSAFDGCFATHFRAKMVSTED